MAGWARQPFSDVLRRSNLKLYRCGRTKSWDGSHGSELLVKVIRFYYLRAWIYSRRSVLLSDWFFWQSSALSPGLCFKLGPDDGGNRVSNSSTSTATALRVNSTLMNVSI